MVSPAPQKSMPPVTISTSTDPEENPDDSDIRCGKAGPAAAPDRKQPRAVETHACNEPRPRQVERVRRQPCGQHSSRDEMPIPKMLGRQGRDRAGQATSHRDRPQQCAGPSPAEPGMQQAGSREVQPFRRPCLADGRRPSGSPFHPLIAHIPRNDERRSPALKLPSVLLRTNVNLIGRTN